MTPAAQSFPYVPRDPSLGNASLAPMLPLTEKRDTTEVQISVNGPFVR